MHPLQSTLAAIIAAAFVAGAAPAQNKGIEGREAPAWDVEEWFNLPEGKKSLDIGDLRGQVIFLYCFQAW